MKQMKNVLVLIILTLSLFVSSCTAQIKNAKIETAKVYGNCNTCKENIEKAANKKHISKAVWDKNNKTVLLTYDSTKTSADAILKKIAYAGYDNQNYMAPDEAYNKLEECCKYVRKMQKEEIKHETKNDAIMVEDTIKQTSNAETKNVNQLLGVYAAYFSLKDALAKDNGNSAATYANNLYNEVDKVMMEKLTTTEHTVWMKYQKEMSDHAKKIASTKDLKSQREHFISLSQNVYELMKVIKNDEIVYYDYCPMANDGKGANWLSLQQAITNPYMGKAMPTCGKVQEKIAK